MQEEMNKKCSNCGKLVECWMKFCPNCGQSLSANDLEIKRLKDECDAALPIIKTVPTEETPPTQESEGAALLPLLKTEQSEGTLPFLKQEVTQEDASDECLSLLKKEQADDSLPALKQETDDALLPFLKRQEESHQKWTEDDDDLRRRMEEGMSDNDHVKNYTCEPQRKDDVDFTENTDYGTKKTANEKEAGGGAQFCSSCGRKLVPGARFCKFCGKAVEDMLRHDTAHNTWGASNGTHVTFKEMSQHFTWTMPRVGGFDAKVKYFLARIFNPYGRINRGTYIMNWIVCFILNLTASGFLNGTNSLLDVLLWFVFSALISSYAWCLAIRRCHDFNLSGWHIFKLFIPLYQFYFLIKLFFFRGMAGPNRYGDDPLIAEHWII